jgi:hypothetical protein
LRNKILEKLSVIIGFSNNLPYSDLEPSGAIKVVSISGF